MSRRRLWEFEGGAGVDVGCGVEGGDFGGLLVGFGLVLGWVVCGWLVVIGEAKVIVSGVVVV